MGRVTYIAKNYPRDAIIYLAGIVDGEGCLMIRRHHYNAQKYGHTYTPKLEVCNTDKPLIDWIISIFGGRIDQLGGKQRQTTNRKPAYRWTCEGLRLTHICELIYPFSIIKKPQIDIILQIRRDLEKPKAHRGQQGIKPRTDEEFELRHNLYLELKKLHASNRRKK